MKSKINSSHLIFLCIAIFYAIGSLIWWYQNTPVIPMGGSAIHFNDIFSEKNLFFNAPLLSWIMRAIFALCGLKYFDLQIIFINYIFLLLALYYTYKIGLTIKNKQTGNIAMSIFSTVPTLYGLCRQYGHQEFHVMVFTVISIYYLIKTDFFKNRKATVLYTLSISAGLLIKDEFLVYFVPPFVYMVIKSLKITDLKKQRIQNISCCVLLTLILAGCHYFRTHIIIKVFNEVIDEIFYPLFSYQWFHDTIISLWEELMSPPVFLLFLISFIWFLFKYKNYYKSLILICLLCPWILLSFILQHKFPEYYFGSVPIAVLIISLFLTNINKKAIRMSVISVILITGFIQYIDFSFIKNFEIFGCNIKYNNNTIKYYDKNYIYSGCTITAYHKNKNAFALTDYIKKNFPDNSLFLYKFIFLGDIGREHLIALFNVNNLKMHDMHPVLLNAKYSDIIIDSESDSIRNIDNVYNKENAIRNIHNIKYKFPDVFNKVKDINNNFIILDSFYLDKKHAGNLKYKITILGRKDLFEGKTVKYPFVPAD